MVKDAQSDRKEKVRGLKTLSILARRIYPEMHHPKVASFAPAS